MSEFATRAAASGALVLIGECPPLGDGELPYAPIVGALRGVVRRGEDGALRGSSSELNRLFGSVEVEPAEPVSADGSQARLFEQLLATMLGAAEGAPLVLIIEDLQWADSSTQSFLTFLVRATRPERFALVLLPDRCRPRPPTFGPTVRPRARACRPGDHHVAWAVLAQRTP